MKRAQQPEGRSCSIVRPCRSPLKQSLFSIAAPTGPLEPTAPGACSNMLTCFVFFKTLHLEKTGLSLKSRVILHRYNSLRWMLLLWLIVHYYFSTFVLIKFLFIAASIILYSALSNVPVSSLCSDWAHDCIKRHGLRNTIFWNHSQFSLFFFIYVVLYTAAWLSQNPLSKGLNLFSPVPR